MEKLITILERFENRFKEEDYKVLRITWSSLSNFGVVLVDTGRDPERFITWTFNNEGMTFSGHYLMELSDGLKDFNTRTATI